MRCSHPSFPGGCFSSVMHSPLYLSIPVLNKRYTETRDMHAALCRTAAKHGEVILIRT